MTFVFSIYEPDFWTDSELAQVDRARAKRWSTGYFVEKSSGMLAETQQNDRTVLQATIHSKENDRVENPLDLRTVFCG